MKLSYFIFTRSEFNNLQLSSRSSYCAIHMYINKKITNVSCNNTLTNELIKVVNNIRSAITCTEPWICKPHLFYGLFFPMVLNNWLWRMLLHNRQLLNWMVVLRWWHAARADVLRWRFAHEINRLTWNIGTGVRYRCCYCRYVHVNLNAGNVKYNGAVCLCDGIFGGGIFCNVEDGMLV